MTNEPVRPPIAAAIDLAREALESELVAYDRQRFERERTARAAMEAENTEDKRHNKNASEMEAQAACEKLKIIIEAAENSNQAGENAAVIAAAAVTASHTSPKDEGLIASEADFLNTELRMANRDHQQVDPDDDWRSSIRGLVEGVRAGEEFNLRKMLAISEEAWVDLIAATQQMSPEDDQIICNHVKRAEGLLCALVTGNKFKEEK